MKFSRSLGEYIIVAAEVVPPKPGGKIHILDDSAFCRGKVMVEPENVNISQDDDILFVRKDGVPLGHEFPPNVMVVMADSVVAILEPEE